jgi:hypothetical protein
LALLTTAMAASPWRWSNPLPHGHHLYDATVWSQRLVQVGELGAVYASEDLESWTTWDSHTTNALRSMALLDERLVVTGEAGTVLYADLPGRCNLISLNTEDWLEGVASGGGRLVAVGDNAAVYTSMNGSVWMRHPQPFGVWLRSIAYGQGSFVVVGEGGFAATSASGTDWQVRKTGTTEHLNKVIFAGTTFIAVGDQGRVLSSASGVDWTSGSAGTTNALYAVAAQGTTMMVAGESELRLREGSGSWLAQTASSLGFPAPVWTYYCALWNGAEFLVGGRSGMWVEGFRTNGSPHVWLTRTEPTRNWLWDLHSVPGLDVCVGDQANILTSVDGRVWSLELPPAAFTNTVFLGVGGHSNLLVAVGTRGAIALSSNYFEPVISPVVSGGVTNFVTNVVSALGLRWEAVSPLPTDRDLQGVANSGNSWVVTGAQGTILTSDDGLKWTRRDAPTSLYLSSVTAFPGGWVATGDDGAVLTSSDGRTWILRPSGTLDWLYRVRFLAGQLVAVGQNGAILVSADGIRWQARSSGTTLWLNDVACEGGHYFAVGSQGLVLFSADGSKWTAVPGFTRKSLYAVTLVQGRFLAAGLEGAILRARARPWLAPPRIGAYSQVSGQNLFLLSGEPDQAFTLDYSSDLSLWQTGAAQEIVAPDGTMLYLEPTNGSPRGFYRSTVIQATLP